MSTSDAATGERGNGGRARHRSADHAQRGFREVGVYERHGRLDGEWKDLLIVERLLGEAADGR